MKHVAPRLYCPRTDIFSFPSESWLFPCLSLKHEKVT
jgi:hypothetical protein